MTLASALPGSNPGAGLAGAAAPFSAGDRHYYPLGLDIPAYAPNSTSVPAMIAAFFAIWAGVMAAGVGLARWRRPGLAGRELAALAWFVLCAFVHTCFEGYYCASVADIASRQHLFAQLWKEYSQADSRYLTQDSFMFSMESLTSFVWGPLSVVTAIAIANRHPVRHVLQLVISTGQFYGTLLYFGTAAFDEAVYGKAFTRPEPYYFYFYYLTMNIIWCIVPATLILQSARAIISAFARLDRLEGAKKAA